MFEDARKQNPEHPFNQAVYDGASVLVVGQNFGCGSSREHAVWALHDFGFRAVVAPSFSDIFFANCTKNGLLPVTLTGAEVAELTRRARAAEGYRLTVDLERREVRDGHGFSAAFEIDEFRRRCLLEGLDDIGLTLRHESEISRYEERRPAWMGGPAADA